ncbi:MAG: hypothetical protein JJE55_08145 [Flavobacteriaceae bacterium]|nr:hypothetical protein [Flavobacteriaceae bacterium]
MSLKVKFWAGWIKPENTISPEWRKRAREAEARESVLLVFEVPKSQETAIVELVEKKLQNL